MSSIRRSRRFSLLKSNYNGNICQTYKSLIERAMPNVYDSNNLKESIDDVIEWRYIIFAGTLLDEEYE